MNSKIKSNVYFPNLNGLRFIAAFLVIIHHTEQLKNVYGIENYWGKVGFIEVIGKLGVVLFFVLSGFLITYLLLFEENKNGRINIKSFYLRRVLRIWPLYFLIVILALFVFPNIEIFLMPGFDIAVVMKDLLSKVILYILFLPNLLSSYYGTIPYASHTWSIGVEEQFYLIWPALLLIFKKNRIVLMFGVILIYMIVIQLVKLNFADQISNIQTIRNFWNSFSIDCMAIGAIYAVLLFNNSKYLKYILNNYVFYFSLILVVTLISNGVHFKNYHYEFFAVFFGIIILNFAANTNIKISLENKYLNYLGNISYGIYMYHLIGIVSAILILKQFNETSNLILYPFIMLITIGLASFSYKYFESYFLKLKQKLTNI